MYWAILLFTCTGVEEVVEVEEEGKVDRQMEDGNIQQMEEVVTCACLVVSGSACTLLSSFPG